MRNIRSISRQLEQISKTTNGGGRVFSSVSNHVKAGPTRRVCGIVEEISALTLPEITQLTDLLRSDFSIKELPFMLVVVPGTGFSGAKVVVKAPHEVFRSNP